MWQLHRLMTALSCFEISFLLANHQGSSEMRIEAQRGHFKRTERRQDDGEQMIALIG